MIEFDLPPSHRQGQRARMAAVQVVKHPAFEYGLRKLTLFHQRLSQNVEFRCMYITGESGTGKTTLIEHYISAFPMERMPSVDIRRAVYVRAPARSSVKGLGYQILSHLGAPTAARMTDFEISSCVRKLLRQMRVEILFIDEVQDLLEWKSASTRIPKLVANFIKEILQETDTGIVLAGLPCIETISSFEKQLKNRTAGGISMVPFHAANPSDREAYRQILLSSVEKSKLVFDFDVSDALTAIRFQVASDGNPSVTKNLINAASTEAEIEGSRSIGMKHIEYAYIMSQEKTEIKIDPFQMSKEELISWVEADATRANGRR